MTIERWLRAIAGFMVLLSVAFTLLVSKNWIWFTVFIGVNLLQSGFTNWCPVKSWLEELESRSKVCPLK